MSKDWPSEARMLVAEVLDGAAAEVDRSARVPPAHLDELARRGFYGFVLSEGMTPDVLIDTAATILGGCLSTGFVWAQHLGALRAVAAGNPALRERFLGPMAAGEYRCGVSYAGARTEPTLFAERTDAGFVVDGTAPFVTGWGQLDALATSVRLRSAATESVATLLIPVAEVEGLTADPLTLVAANASATVRLRFDRVLVGEDRLVGDAPVTAFRAGRAGIADWINGALPLGVLSACLRELRTLAVDDTPYAARYAALRGRFAAALGDPEATYALRADIAHAAVEAAAAVVVAAGSRAALAGSTPERLARQATFALVCTTRDPIRSALLTRLAPNRTPAPD
ncbi:acyl-CoA dehydrogenase family protein [Nocardia sp. NPDC004068]|uniref:acyl-CoA dehydrogenase family protein n=1 Tax=Nocardia sp. NPDC004068 TaxID=3364303 RepID=UPI0036AE81BF